MRQPGSNTLTDALNGREGGTGESVMKMKGTLILNKVSHHLKKEEWCSGYVILLLMHVFGASSCLWVKMLTMNHSIPSSSLAGDFSCISLSSLYWCYLIWALNS